MSEPLWGAKSFELYTTNWILGALGNVLLILIVIVFQHDIRRMLTQVGSGSFLGNRSQVEHGQLIETLTRSAVQLAGRRIGGLIVLAREVGLNDYIEGGSRLDASVSRDLIVSVFHPSSPLHDGALVIQLGRIMAAGCLLPLTTNPNVSKTLGTRHRAAIGLTEETDAVVIVVSEEEGKISLVHEGKITRDLDAGVLRGTLQHLMA